MKLLQRITAKDIMAIEGVSLRTAYYEIKLLKAMYAIERPRLRHYLMYNDMTYVEFLEILRIEKEALNITA